MTTLRKAVAKALLDGDQRRADQFRAVIESRVRRGQAVPSTPVPDDAA